jgi:hypothetical protein
VALAWAARHPDGDLFEQTPNRTGDQTRTTRATRATRATKHRLPVRGPPLPPTAREGRCPLSVRRRPGDPGARVRCGTRSGPPSSGRSDERITGPRVGWMLAQHASLGAAGPAAAADRPTTCPDSTGRWVWRPEWQLAGALMRRMTAYGVTRTAGGRARRTGRRQHRQVPGMPVWWPAPSRRDWSGRHRRGLGPRGC